MQPLSESSAAGVRSLMAAVARSTIVVTPPPSTPGVADWSVIRCSPDVDAFVLAWLAREGRAASRRAI